MAIARSVGGCLLALVLVGVAASCSDDSSSSSEVEATTSAPPDVPDDPVLSYFEGLAAQDEAGLVHMVGASASQAHLYALHEQTLVEAKEAAGQNLEKGTVTPDGESVRVCFGGDPPTCRTFDGIVTDPTSGKVLDFSVDGRPGADYGLFIFGHLGIALLGGTSTLVTASLDLAGQLVVTIETQAGLSPLDLNFPALYVGVDGTTIESSSQITPDHELRPRLTVSLSYTFDGVTGPGVVVQRAAITSPCCQEATVELELR